ncbi:hypothetical protein [Methylobacterium sp. PvR107]|uniref:hypothetical protein n=1 Tax=Methylobacterium sp. PvR107 TaxID=2806597 RepID=UPI001AE1BF63|nr:hypothetical protein [Methylobacterium sp. PvR107]MBP1182634.1 hypothetical protein [Methylobacterium sp. PvR107]
MRIVRRIGRVIESLAVGGVTGTVALVSHALDATIGRVGRLSARLDARLAELARESRARHRQQGRRQIHPVTLK